MPARASPKLRAGAGPQNNPAVGALTFFVGRGKGLRVPWTSGCVERFLRIVGGRRASENSKGIQDLAA